MIRKPDEVWCKTSGGEEISFRAMVFVHFGREMECFGRRKEAVSVVEMGVRFVPSSPESALQILLGKGVVSESV